MPAAQGQGTDDAFWAVGAAAFVCRGGRSGEAVFAELEPRVDILRMAGENSRAETTAISFGVFAMI